MPELPEVETIVRGLAPRVRGKTVGSIEFLSPRVLRGGPEPLIRGCEIQEVSRYGKHILLRFQTGTLAIHLGMTGKLLLDGEVTPYLRAELQLMGGSRLLFDDIRQFGRMDWSETLPKNVAKLGPDALEIEAKEFAEALAKRSTRIKSLLLNQEFLRGLGNIYVDEALFRSEIHPLTPASTIKREASKRLHRAIVDVLQEAIEGGGSSISDYVDASGNRGAFQERHRVYGREGKPCVVCSSPVERVVVGQRGTHFCPRCQRG